jgi:translocator assembly and maintenance protein 41
MNNNLIKLKTIIPTVFPNINHIYAYGSVVIQQKDNIGKMTDLIFIVNDVKKFHTQNILINKQHYSSTALALGIDNLAKVNSFGTKIYYNPSVKIEDVNIKYGIIQESDFINNLTHWDNLFVAGRFHKPILKLNGQNYMEDIIQKNQQAAVIVFKI